MPSRIAYPWAAPPEPGDAIEVADGILWLRLPLPLKLDHVNCYAVREDDGWTLIDTGFDTPHAREIWAALLDGPLSGAPVRRVLVTHHHPDHIGLAGWFQAQGAELVTSRTAWLFGRMLSLDIQNRPTPQHEAFWRRAGMPADLLSTRMADRPLNSADVVHPLPPGFTRLVDGQHFRLGGRDWRVAMGEGHAPEHITLWTDDLVIGGDQLLASISPNLGVYPTEPDADPVQGWLDSCARLAPLANADQIVLPGHKLPFTGLPLRLRQMLDNHESALDRLTAALAVAPRTAVGCFDLLFGRRIGPGEYGLALAEAVGHINCLRHRGQIAPEGLTADGGVLWRA
ncbi:MAG: MBL fold hydrolase [Paracoccus denitrificans]|nr:MAG: MBL fold hydrolase [Paracoccus denitrificans]PZO83168.1 MAG: MBL fold hydrolase [Paracoccus denitrificans]